MVSQSGTFGSVTPDVDGKFINAQLSGSVGGSSSTGRGESFANPDSSRRTPAYSTPGNIDATVSPFLSSGVVQQVPGVDPASAASVSTCLHRVCASLGVEVPYSLCRVKDLPQDALLFLQKHHKSTKIYYEYSSVDHRSNHVQLVSPTVSTARIELVPSDSNDSTNVFQVVGVTNLVQFFNNKNMFAHIQFYSGEFQDTFGGDILRGSNDPDPAALGAAGPSVVRQHGRGDSGGSGPRGGARDPSVDVPDSRHGAANVSSGVLRPKRRVIAAKSEFSPFGAVVKSYSPSQGVKFNNLGEIYLDMISRDYAQEILEELFKSWGVDTSDSDAVKYAEDLVWAFMIATTASNKADYYREFEIPQKTSTISVSFDVFSKILAEAYAVTRRQFARSVADDMRRYIREPENVHLLPRLADRVGCDPQMASLAFDGSTHCTGLTSAELSFTKLLENRNLFEDDRVLADGASQRLMQGMSSGPRSIVSR